MKDKNSHAYNFKKNFGPHLNAFEKLKDWPDFCNWLQKTLKLLEDYPTYYIPEKLTFAKRLAQCLNPTLPHGTHKIALQVYARLFKNLRTGDDFLNDLPIFCIGLFPFFQNCSIQVKPEYLQIIEDNFLIHCEILPMIVGLVTSILPGLEEKDESIQKRIVDILGKLQVCVGERFLVGALWIAILRTPKVRATAIQYLMRLGKKKAKRDTVEQMGETATETGLSITTGDQNDRDLSSRMDPPSKSQMNAELMLRGINLIIARPELESEDPTQVVCKQLYEDLLQVICEPPNNYQIHFPKGSVVLSAALACMEDEASIKKLMLDYLGNHLNLNEDVLTEKEKIVLLEGAIKLFEKKDISINRRLYKWIFGGDIDNEIEVNRENAKAFQLMIEALKNLFKSTPADAQEAIQPIKIIQNIFIEHEELCQPILQSLAVSFITYYYDASSGQARSYGEEVSIQAEKLIDNIADNFQIVLDSFKNEIVNSDTLDKMKIMKMVKFIAQKFIAKETNNLIRRSSYHRLTISGILGQIAGLDLTRLHVLTEKDLNHLRFGSHTLNLLLEPLNELVKGNESVLLEVCSDEAFVGAIASFIDGVSKMLRLYSKEYHDTDLQPFYYIIQDLMNFTIDSFAFTQIHQPLPKGEIPEWLTHTYQSVKSENQVIADICLESVIKIFEIFSRLAQEMPTYNKIWYSIRDTSLSKSINDMISFDLLKTLVVICFSKLDLRESRKTINYLLLLSKFAIEVINDHVRSEFSNPNVEHNVVCFRQCIKFWQLTEELIGPEIDILRTSFSFKMLPFIDHENPLLRHSAKNWLSLALGRLHNILDVIFEALLINTEWKYSQSSSPAKETTLREAALITLYEKEYPTDTVTKCIKHLKDMLIVMGDAFCTYITSTKVSLKLMSLVNKLGEKKLTTSQGVNFLDLLAVICLRYIEGDVADEGTEFHIRNLSVKATASEFLEMILSKYNSKDSIIAQISFYLLDPLSVVLKKAVERDESTILIQILSVLSVILFKANLQAEKNYQEKYFHFVQKKSFLDTLIQGLSSKHLYIVIEFKDFLSSIVTVTAEYMRHPALTEIVSLILKGYYRLISANNAGFMKTRKQARMGPGGRHNTVLSLLTVMIEERDSENHENEIEDEFLEALLDGLDFCLKTFVGNDNVVSTDYKKSEEPSMFVNIITLGLRSTPKDETFFKKHEDVGKSILNDLRTMLDSFSTCWDIDADFARCCNSTDWGCLGYNYEETKSYISKVDIEKYPKINRKIVKIIRPFGKRFMRKLVEELMKYWRNSFDDVPSPVENVKCTAVLRTIINIICDSNMNPIDLISNLNKTDILKAIKDSNVGLRKKAFKTGQKKVEVHPDNSLREIRILFFIYNYLKFLKIDYGLAPEARKVQYLSLWTETIGLLKTFSESISLMTSFWILEILVLLSNKYNASVLNEDMANEVHKIFLEESSYISNYAALKVNIGYADVYSKGYSVLSPIPPTLFEFHNNNKSKHVYNDEKMIIINEVTRTHFYRESDLETKCRYQCFKMLAALMKSSFLTTSNYKADKLVIRIRGIVDNMFPILFSRSWDNITYVECASEVIHECVVQNPNKLVVRELQKDIFEIFNMGPFFRCTSNTLKYWAKIIDTTVSFSKTDVLEEYLKFVNFSSLFTSRTNEDKTRISSFERVCFIIYSGEVDKYMTKSKIKSLMEKIREVLKDENPNPSLQILIFFILRVLILRLSPTHLSELFRNIWPILLTLLIDVFRPKPVEHQKKTKTEICVLLAGLKLLELLSICNVDEFNLYQWVFIYDYFGVTIDMINTKKEYKGVAYPMKFQPYLFNTLPNGLKIDYLGSAFDKEVYQVESSKKEKRRILITQNNLETDFELQAKAQELLTYMVYLNQTRVYIDNDDIETLIQKDFIGLSEIFNE